jgi:hypothetical protein
LVEQVDTCLHSSDYSRALDLLQSAVAEFPGDTELAELEKLARDGVERKTEAHRLMTEGQSLFAQKLPEGIKLLRQAYEVDEKNSLARAVLANSLVELANATVETDWREAENLAREALDLNPSHPMGKTLRTLILDKKRETAVEECVSQARKLQTVADLTGALSRIEEGLSVYPRESRLIQIHETLQRDLQTQRRQIRRRDLEELRRMESEIDASKDAASKQALGEQLKAVADKYPNDGEVLSVANGFLHRLGLSQVASTGATGSPENNSPTLTHSTPPAPVSSIVTPPTSKIAPAAIIQVSPPVSSAPQISAPVAGASAAKPPASASNVKASSSIPKRQAGSSQRYKTIVLALAGALILVAAIFIFRRHPAPPVGEAHLAPPPAAIPVASPPTLLLPSMKLSSDTGEGKITFDGQVSTELQSGQWSLNEIPVGEHKVTVDGPREKVSFTFSSDAGTAPVVKGPIASKGVLAIVVSAMADHLHVYSSDAAAKVSLDSQPPVDVPQDGLDLPSVSAGAHELTIIRGSDQYKLEVSAGAAPMLNEFLESNQNLGTLLVVTGQDQAKVFVDGKLQPYLTRGGQLRIPNLELRDYSVRVSKSDFQDLPEQKIRIRKGEQAKLVFNLQPIPHLASLAIQGGVPGTAVLIDQTPAGTVQPNGTLTVATVNPGDHTVELRRDRFKAKQIKKHFVVGTSVSLTAAETALEPALAELKINFTPADAQVSLAKAGESPLKVSSGGTLNLPAGSYTLTAKMADNFTRSTPVEVTAGQSRSLDLSLSPDGMSKWEDPSGWKQDKGSYVRKGGDFVMYSVTPASGTFVFSATLVKGHRLQWMLNCINANNYVLFQMDDNNFYRTVVRDGQKGDEVKIPHKVGKKSVRTLQVRVEAKQIVHQIRQGDGWVVLDRWSDPESNLTLGRFGFFIPGNDQVALSSFSRYLDLNPR